MSLKTNNNKKHTNKSKQTKNILLKIAYPYLFYFILFPYKHASKSVSCHHIWAYSLLLPGGGDSPQRRRIWNRSRWKITKNCTPPLQFGACRATIPSHMGSAMLGPGLPAGQMKPLEYNHGTVAFHHCTAGHLGLSAKGGLLNQIICAPGTNFLK